MVKIITYANYQMKITALTTTAESLVSTKTWKSKQKDFG